MGYMGSVIAGALAVACVSGNGDYETMFKEFKATYGREYASTEEERTRFEYFVGNMDRAAALNRANPFARFGVNALADLSEEEARQMRGAVRERQRRVNSDAGSLLPQYTPKKDWRTKGAVTPVKDQGQCSAGWAFATAGVTEGSWTLTVGKLIPLSAQQSVSCDTNSHGCHGGTTRSAFESISAQPFPFFATEHSYPYTSSNGIVARCTPLHVNETGVAIKKYVNVSRQETALATFVETKGPVAISVDAKHWSLYRSGVMTVCPATDVNHGALIVGYDSTATPPYWIVKNSWGTTWGEHGYIQIEMWKNMCGITDEPVWAGTPPM